MSATLVERPTVPPAGIPRPPAARGATWRAALRLARREVRRAKGRTALVVALVAVPVAAMVFAEVMIRSGNLTERQRALVGLGSVADARFDGAFSPANGKQAGARLALPFADGDHTDVTTLYFGRVRLGGKYRDAQVTVADLASPLLRGAYDVTSGSAPLTPNDAAVSIAAARQYGVKVGDRIRSKRGTEWTVSGVYRYADQTDQIGVVVAHAPPDPARVSDAATQRFVRASADQLRAALQEPGGLAVVRDPSVARAPSFDAGTDRLLPLLGLYAIGTIALFITGIVVSAAFAAGARRQLRTLGLAAASGAAPGYVRLAVVAQGLVCGALGVVVGFVLGAAGVAAAAPHLDRLVGFVVPGLHPQPLDLLLVAGLAVAAAAAAAAVPAIGLGRVPVLVALAGRRPLHAARTAVPVFGLVLFIVGMGGLAVAAGTDLQSMSNTLFLAYVASSVAMLLGAVVSTPWLVGRLEPLSVRLRGPARLAARAITRSRGRTGPIVAAILVTTGAAAFVAITNSTSTTSTLGPIVGGGERAVVRLFASFDGTADDFPSVTGPLALPAGALERVTAVVPDAVVFTVHDLTGSKADAVGGLGWSVDSPGPSTDPRHLGLFAGTELVMSDRTSLQAIGVPADALDAWERGTALVLGPDVVRDGTITLRHERFDPTTGAPTLEQADDVPALELARLVTGRNETGSVMCDAGGTCSTVAPPPLVVLPADVIARTGLVGSLASTTAVIGRRPLTRAQQDELRVVRQDLLDASTAAAERGDDAVGVFVSFVDDTPPSRLWQLLLLAVATFAALGVTAIGLSLSAAEGRADDATFLALGAPGRLRRSLRAWEALMTAGIGCAVGVALGAIAGAVFARSTHRDRTTLVHLDVPWLTLLGLAVAVPVVAATVFWLCTRPRRAVLLRED